MPDVLRLMREKADIDRQIMALLGVAMREDRPPELPPEELETAALPKRKRTRTQRLPIREYVCVRCKYQFKSNLEKLDARCPRCAGLDVDYYVEPPVVRADGSLLVKRPGSWKQYACGPCRARFSSRRDMGEAPCPRCGETERIEYSSTPNADGLAPQAA